MCSYLYLFMRINPFKCTITAGVTVHWTADSHPWRMKEITVSHSKQWRTCSGGFTVKYYKQFSSASLCITLPLNAIYRFNTQTYEHCHYISYPKPNPYPAKCAHYRTLSLINTDIKMINKTRKCHPPSNPPRLTLIHVRDTPQKTSRDCLTLLNKLKQISHHLSQLSLTSKCIIICEHF